MADNNKDGRVNNIGNGRFNLVDPNKFENQASTGLFGDPNYNISVPNEDLSIMVELVTQTKNRTILNTKQKINTVSSTDNDRINVSFIDGSKNQSTGDKNFLTTSYTDMFTEMKDVEEAFGISNIDIDFNSSYAPMVNINFIDIKGAGLFQMGAKSKYSVLFRLPYPLFELTVKGFYGKPVKYCLHMLKCNTKFNSSTGNFEIAAQFVGYSYAMLSDMLIGYMKAAALTPAGEDALKKRGMISIKEYMKKIGDINASSLKEILDNADPDVNNLSIIEDIKKDLESMRNLIYDAINSINIGRYEVIKVPDENENGVTLSKTIAIVKDPNSESPTFDDTDNQTILQNYNTKILEKVTEYNKKVEALQDLKIDDITLMTFSVVLSFYSDIENQTDGLKDRIKNGYAVQDDSRVTEIANRLKKASTEANRETNNIKFYDLTNALLEVNDKDKKLKIKQEELTVIVGEKIRTYISDQLGFDTSIRSIVRMFTVHIEIFLEQLFDVSNKYNTDVARGTELAIFNTPDRSKQIDVNNKDIEKGFIYPWPEYFEDGVEKYLGSKKGPLNTPINVPEIKFVEELYEAMKRQRDAENEENNLEAATTVPGWLSINPVDSWYFNQSQTNPYGRLPDSANHDDFARLAVLRAAGYMGFSNKFLGDEEIKEFAKQEAALIVDKLKDDTDGKIIRALNLNYDTPDKYGKVTGKITDAISNFTSQLLREPSSTDPNYRYYYITSNRNAGDRMVLPVSQDFTDAVYNLENEFTHGFTLSNAITNEYVNNGQIEDKVDYIHILTKDEYEKYSVTLPSTQTPTNFNVEGLRKDMTNYEDLKSAGFVANNGKYGVQEFLKIDHVNTIDAPFFTLFYNRGNENVKLFKTYVSPTLCRPREATGTTTFDISTVIRLPTTNKIDSLGPENINEIYNKRKDIYENIFLAKEYINNNTNVSCPFFNFTVSYRFSLLDKKGKVMNINLFGSRFYNAQTLEGKAFLFLHCFPWRGLTGGEAKDGGPFALKEIINVFTNRTGFIQVPKYFLAFLGGIIKRSKFGELIKFSIGEGKDEEQLLPTFTNGNGGNEIPKKDEFLVRNQGLTVGPMTFSSFFSLGDSFSVDTGYAKIPEVLKNLPPALQNTLLQEFNNFVLNEYDTMRKSFEILPVGNTGEGDDASWKKRFNLISDSAILSNDNSARIRLDDITANLVLVNNKSFKDTFNVFSFIPDQGMQIDTYPMLYEWFKYNYIIEYKDGSDPETKLRDAIISYKYLSNESIFVWEPPKEIFTTIVGVNTSLGFAKTPFKNPILISQANFNAYFEEFKTLVSNTVSQIEENKKFLTTDQEEIKFEIYRNLKKMYDKWIAFSDTKDRIIFQCCARGTNTPVRLTTDEKLQKKRNGTQLELIDSFRFVDSFFRDIGDKFNINPFMVNQMLHETTNTNFYSFLSRILTDNNFDFVALPTFIDYNDEKEVLDIFKPYPYYEAKNLEAPSGPAFVCVYVGQTSTKLDFGEDEKSQYPNDGFDLTPECLNCPKGVTGNPNDSGGKGDWEDVASAFVVRYGKQNQNFFKDISLDQAEFGATAESLEITDALSNTLSDSSKSFYGQNLYDVYSVRSYKVEVEMMGDAMIQPMMYFQLDNMPMFHGAYLITHVKHSIKPHYMSTVFNGTRIKSAQTPLIDAASLYGALLGTFALPASTGTISSGGTGINYGKIPLPPEKIGNVVVNYTKSSPFAPGKGAFNTGNPEYIVLHWTAGVKYGGPEYNGLGYHFQITETGEIIQTADLGQKTSHAGCWKENKSGVLTNKDLPCAELNGRSIGISYVGGVEIDKNSVEAYVRTQADWDNTNLNLGHGSYNSKAQWEGIVNAILLAKIAHPTINSITSHHLTSADKEDVGDAFPWNKLLDDIYAKTTAAGTPWKPLFADKWYDDSGTGQGRLVHQFGGTIKKENLLSNLTQPEIESSQPRNVKVDKNALKLETIFNYLNAGLNNKNLVIGIMANMSVESTFLPIAAGDRKTTIPWIDTKTGKSYTPLRDSSGTIACSWGLTQVNVCGGAGVEYLNWAGKTNASNDEKIAVLTDPNKHMDFVIKKAKEIFPNDYKELKTPETWAYEWSKKYENCADCANVNSKTNKERIGIAASLKTQNFYGTQTSTNTAKTITIGDSISVGLKEAYPNQIKGVSAPVSLNVVGINSTGFLNNLNLSSADLAVKNVILSMGSNDGWQSTNAIKDSIINKIKSLYPNAKYYILNGSYGWAGLASSNASAVNNYISYYSARGFEVIGTVTSLPTHPKKGDALFNSFATSLKAKGII